MITWPSLQGRTIATARAGVGGFGAPRRWRIGVGREVGAATGNRRCPLILFGDALPVLVRSQGAEHDAARVAGRSYRWPGEPLAVHCEADSAAMQRVCRAAARTVGVAAAICPLALAAAALVRAQPASRGDRPGVLTRCGQRMAAAVPAMEGVLCWEGSGEDWTGLRRQLALWRDQQGILCERLRVVSVAADPCLAASPGELPVFEPAAAAESAADLLHQAVARAWAGAMQFPELRPPAIRRSHCLRRGLPLLNGVLSCLAIAAIAMAQANQRRLAQWRTQPPAGAAAQAVLDHPEAWQAWLDAWRVACAGLAAHDAVWRARRLPWQTLDAALAAGAAAGVGLESWEWSAAAAGAPGQARLKLAGSLAAADAPAADAILHSMWRHWREAQPELAIGRVVWENGMQGRWRFLAELETGGGR